MKELMQGPDVEAAKDIKVEDIGGLGESKGTMDFPRSAAGVAKKIMGQRMFKGLPKQWKGRGDYFFEAQDDGSLKITGGNAAKSLTGGKSTVITDSMKIKEILEKARGGDIVEEGATYELKQDEDFKSLYNKEELGEMMRGEPELKATLPRSSVPLPVEELGVNLKDRLETSTPEDEGISRVYDGMEEEKGVLDLKENAGVLRPKREYRNPTMEAANYIMQEMERRPEIKDVLQKALDALGVDVQSAERVEEGE